MGDMKSHRSLPLAMHALARRLLLSSVPAAIACLAGATLPAQWHFLPLNAAQNVHATDWYVAHDTGNGLVALSAIAARWTTISPAGATFLQHQDAAIVTRENPTTLRGWSAYRNATATQTVSANASAVSGFNAANFILVLDNAPSTNGILRAYSAYTNTWASVALQTLPSFSAATDANVAVQIDGLAYHAYSAFTGQWTTYTASVAGGVPFTGADYAAVDLRGSSGPFRFAAFSAPRGVWSVSPTYPTTGAARVSAGGARGLAIRTDLGAPATFRYAGFSPSTAQWVTSSLVHNSAALLTATAFKNVVRISDLDPAARFEIFGAGNGIWQSLTGANLTEESVHEDFHVAYDASGSQCTVYGASALVGGGYTSVVVPSFFPGFSQGSHEMLVTGGFPNVAYGYSAATNTFSAPVPQPTGSGVAQGSIGGVGAFVVQGSAGIGTSPQAFTARWSNWVGGPAIGPNENWSMAVSTSIAVAIRDTFPGAQYHVFDQHRNAWLAPVTTSAPLPTWAMGPSCFFLTDVPGTYTSYAVQRGDWTVQGGFGAITSPGGNINMRENLAWFTDANNRICVFTTLPRAQAWMQWPISGRWATSGSGLGSTPYVGVSACGALPEYGLLYAALALPPGPLTIPGILGALDLDPLGAVQVADLGLFDADGVREATLQIGGAVPHGVQLWLQLVTVNVLTGQIAIHDRATGSTLF
jgi:hypothetical protein